MKLSRFNFLIAAVLAFLSVAGAAVPEYSQ